MDQNIGPIIDERDYWTLKAMSQYGGGFVKRLAELAHHADRENYRRIKATWPEYWEQYEATGIRLEAAAKDHE